MTNEMTNGLNELPNDLPNDLNDAEREFFEAIDRNTAAEQAIFEALLDLSDDQYYTLFEIAAEHVCGQARIQVYPERSGTLYRCLNCGVAGIIGG